MLANQMLVGRRTIEEMKVAAHMLRLDVVECYGGCSAFGKSVDFQAGVKVFGVLSEDGFVEDEGFIATLDRH